MSWVVNSNARYILFIEFQKEVPSFRILCMVRYFLHLVGLKSWKQSKKVFFEKPKTEKLNSTNKYDVFSMPKASRKFFSLYAQNIIRFLNIWSIPIQFSTWGSPHQLEIPGTCPIGDLNLASLVWPTVENQELYNLQPPPHEK